MRCLDGDAVPALVSFSAQGSRALSGDRTQRAFQTEELSLCPAQGQLDALTIADAYTGSGIDQGSRYSLVKSLSASGSPMNCSFSGSKCSTRPAR